MLPLFSLSFPQSLSHYLGSCKTIIFQLLHSPVKKRFPSLYTLLFNPLIFKFYFNISKSLAIIFLLSVQIDPHLECETLQVAPLSLQCDPIISKCFLVQQVWYFIYSSCAFSAPEMELFQGALFSFSEKVIEAPRSGFAQGYWDLIDPRVFLWAELKYTHVLESESLC